MAAQKQAQICNWEFKKFGLLGRSRLPNFVNLAFIKRGKQRWAAWHISSKGMATRTAVSDSRTYPSSSEQQHQARQHQARKQRDSTKRYYGTAQRDSTKRRQHRRTAQQKCTTAHTRHDSTEKTARNDMTAPHDGKTETHNSTARQHRTTAHT